MNHEIPRGSVPELHSINHELAELLRSDPLSLSLGADAALEDELIICGILGGKDVGKSTLINTLAGVSVSVDAVEVGRGTDTPMVYVHADMEEAARRRLGSLELYADIDVTLHRAGAIRNAVLVDLPDFDSEFLDHLHTVRAIAPRLDRVLWIQTPRKIGDRAWVELFHEVIKEANNVHCVLNKVDELLSDGEAIESSANGRANDSALRATSFWRAQQEWVARSLEAAGYSQPKDRRFLIAAAFPEPDVFSARIAERWDDPGWSRYGSDRPVIDEIGRLNRQDIDRLRACVLSAVPAEQVQSIKAANREYELQVTVSRMTAHYDLERTTRRLAQACDPEYCRQVLDDSLGPQYCASVGEGLQSRLRRDTALADELLERRVERWPLLPLVHWPFGWLSRALGRRVSPQSRFAFEAVNEPFERGGRTLRDRIELLRSRILGDHAAVAQQMKLDHEIPAAAVLEKQVIAAARRLPPMLENRLLDNVCARDRKASFLGKAGLWLILLWFPFLQPILAGLLEMYAESGTWSLAHGAYRITVAFSAAHLLAGFAIVTGIFVAIVAGMYARGLRAIRTLRRAEPDSSIFIDAVDEIIIRDAMAPMVKPFQERLERVSGLRARLDAAVSPH